MKTYPLESLSVAEAKEMQFRLVDSATRHLRGRESLSNGDLGVVPAYGRPEATKKVECILAEFFGAEAAALVRGAGSGALRSAVWALAKAGDSVVVHDAPVYSTTRRLFDSMGLKTVICDFNRSEQVAALSQNDKGARISFVLIQHARQKMDDRYALSEVVSLLKKSLPQTPILVDDNYAALKVPRIGVQWGTDLSAFSAFKLLGPEGIGCIVGRRDLIESIHEANYSGGGQVQGHEAMEALRGMIYAPVALALQAEVIEELSTRLAAGEVAGVKAAFIANAQSKVLLIELEYPVARELLERCERLGAAPWPVGAESKYEFAPMFYRVSGTFLAADPGLGERMIRVNPMRAGADTVLRIFKTALQDLEKRIG